MAHNDELLDSRFDGDLGCLLAQWTSDHRLTEAQSEAILRRTKADIRSENAALSYKWWRRIFSSRPRKVIRRPMLMLIARSIRASATGNRA